MDRQSLMASVSWKRLCEAFHTHLHFTLHCRHHGVFPPSLQLKCSMKGHMIDRIITRAQNALMNARIDHIKWSLKQYGDRTREESEILRTAIPPEVSDKIEGWMSSAHVSGNFPGFGPGNKTSLTGESKARKVARTPRTPPLLTYRQMNRKI